MNTRSKKVSEGKNMSKFGKSDETHYKVEDGQKSNENISQNGMKIQVNNLKPSATRKCVIKRNLNTSRSAISSDSKNKVKKSIKKSKQKTDENSLNEKEKAILNGVDTVSELSRKEKDTGFYKAKKDRQTTLDIKGEEEKIRKENSNKNSKSSSSAKDKRKYIGNAEMGDNSIKENEKIKLRKYSLVQTSNNESENSLTQAIKCKNKTKSESTKKRSTKTEKPISSKTKNLILPELSSDEEDEWQEIDELAEILKSGEEIKNEENSVEVHLESNVIGFKEKRKKRSHQELFEDYIRKQVNKGTKEIALNVHKTHVLCLLAHGMYLNKLLCSDNILLWARNILPAKYHSPKRVDMSYIDKFLKWFCETVKISENIEQSDDGQTFDEVLKARFGKKIAKNNKELVLIFTAISRAAGLTVRLVQNLSAITWKPSTDSIIRPFKNRSLDGDETCSKASLHQFPSSVPSKSNEESGRSLINSNEKKVHKQSKLPKGRKRSSQGEKRSSNSDEDFQCNVKNKKTKVSPTAKKGKKISDVFNDWAEIYAEEEEIWVSVDVKRNKYHCTSEIESRCSSLSYVVAFNQDRSLKDVTKRYVSNFLSIKNKIHCNEEWWNSLLRPFTHGNDKSYEEDKELDEKLKEQPMPKSISEYKNHPLYALRRHLLKFEAIYPPDIEPLGHVKGEPVYPRSAVTTLRSRDIWFKEAKCVRVDEQPFNIVKARPKWDKNLCQMTSDRMLELFGEWQVEDYEPPVAVGGKVPVNEYGNVDLFKPQMLPRGCVHLPISGIGKVARKLNIDCAAAVVGFEYQGGGSYPVMDGFVVCEQYKDIILDAWNEEQVVIARKAEEKRLARIYGNWRRLIKGMILKERLREKFGDFSSLGKAEDNEITCKKKKRKEVKSSCHDDIVTHDSNVKLEIDFDSKVYQEKGKKSQKKSSKKHEGSGKCNPKNLDGSSSQLNSDSETEDVDEKRNKIRSILQWNPTTSHSSSSSSLRLTAEPSLSDSSDGEAENNHQESLLQNEKDSIAAAFSSNQKRSVKVKSSKPVKRRKIVSRSNSSSDLSDFVADSHVKTKTDRARRAPKLSVSYKESDESQSDITISESEAEDKLYDPLVEQKKVKTLFSDSDSDD